MLDARMKRDVIVEVELSTYLIGRALSNKLGARFWGRSQQRR